MSDSKWSNKLSFIITTSAFAIGLGNIWRFPYITGESGGGAFLLVYLALMALIGIPILTIEVALGRMAKTTMLLGFGNLSGKPLWNGLGWLGVISCLLIMGFYVMIMAWILIYIGECLFGNISELAPDAISGHFDTVASQLGKVIAVVFGILATAFFVVKRGLHSGLEKYAKILMVGLCAIILGLVIWAATLDEAMKGYQWLLSPDFSKVDFKLIMTALGQLFFSIGVGMAVAFVFGGYTDKKENLISSVIWIVVADTFFAVLAGFMLFPMIFSFGLSPDSGPNLIFVTMTSVFNKLEYGWAVGAVFFLLLFLAGFTTLISCIQGLKDSFKDKYKLSNLQGLLLVTSVIGLLAIPVVFSYSDDPIYIFGKTVFDFLDYLTTTVLLPLCGLLMVLFAAHVIGFKPLKEHLSVGLNNFKISKHWKIVLVWVLPIAVTVILVNGLLNS